MPTPNKAVNKDLQQAQERIKQLESLVKAYQKIEEHLIPLPNGDLHRGFKTHSNIPNIDVEVIGPGVGSPLSHAISKCLKASEGGHPLTCLWCGLQYGVPGPQNLGGEKLLGDHLKKDHPAVVQGWDTMQADALMANLAEAKARLGESLTDSLHG